MFLCASSVSKAHLFEIYAFPIISNLKKQDFGREGGLSFRYPADIS